MTLPTAVTVTDVALRDGLQDEPRPLPTADKLALLEGLAGAGLRSIEAGAFVRADRVPQLADSEELFARATLPAGVTCSGLVMNVPGARRALAAGVPEVRVVVSASEGHSRANAGRGADEALEEVGRAVELLTAAHEGPAVDLGIATAFVCPYDGPTAPDRLARIAATLVGRGVRAVSLADTLGAATPLQVRAGVLALREAVPGTRVGLHLHDTYGMALAGVWEALGQGVDWFDAALGGIGGCPFAPGAAGNVATEDLVGLLQGVGI
ncbi:MAG TPA: hydroxymethylglutaryl-CoA lyase, partial [Acidimicrobiales bacterium]|nr:hydroxymethylglutaryl-CoA lyase [Acidimicrobiales bacterium]